MSIAREYAEKMKSLRETLARVNRLVAALPEQAGPATNYGHIGDLGRIEEILQEAADILNQKEGSYR